MSYITLPCTGFVPDLFAWVFAENLRILGRIQTDSCKVFALQNKEYEQKNRDPRAHYRNIAC